MYANMPHIPTLVVVEKKNSIDISGTLHGYTDFPAHMSTLGHKMLIFSRVLESPDAVRFIILQICTNSQVVYSMRISAR